MDGRPWFFAAGTALATLFVFGSIGAGAIYLMGDRVVEALQTREARATAAYEERIADLRNQLDRLTTRQHVDRDAIGRQVEDLLDQQERLADRFERLAPLLERARGAGLLSDDTGEAKVIPSPTAGSDAASTDLPLPASTEGLDLRRSVDQVKALPADRIAFSHIADLVIPTIRRSVDYVEEQQTERLGGLAKEARSKADRIADLLVSEGIESVDSDPADVGGPFVEPPAGGSFEDSLTQLDQALGLLQRLKSHTDRLPLADPMPGGTRTSTFGVRLDPFFKRQALHTGVDFAIDSGTPVRVTAPGQVVSAGEEGGYGLMVEVDHGDGVTTRYGHLSRIDARVGQSVDAGDTIGAVGSTGRSTGPQPSLRGSGRRKARGSRTLHSRRTKARGALGSVERTHGTGQRHQVPERPA